MADYDEWEIEDMESDNVNMWFWLGEDFVGGGVGMVNFSSNRRTESVPNHKNRCLLCLEISVLIPLWKEFPCYCCYLHVSMKNLDPDPDLDRTRPSLALLPLSANPRLMNDEHRILFSWRLSETEFVELCEVALLVHVTLEPFPVPEGPRSPLLLMRIRVRFSEGWRFVSDVSHRFSCPRRCWVAATYSCRPRPPLLPNGLSSIGFDYKLEDLRCCWS